MCIEYMQGSQCLELVTWAGHELRPWLKFHPSWLIVRCVSLSLDSVSYTLQHMSISVYSSHHPPPDLLDRLSSAVMEDLQLSPLI